MAAPDRAFPDVSAAPRGAMFAGRIEPLAIATGAALIFGAILRGIVGAEMPLWIDETLTAAFAAQTGFGKAVEDALLDCSAPLYYAVIHIWSLAFGASNAALRFPSVMFGTAAALVVLVPVRAIPRDVRLLWCALLALWIPGLYYSQEARCYTLLLLLCVAVTVAYVRLIDRPDLGHAALWTGLSSLAILTHYHAAILICCQGVAYLAVHRGRALRTWPAALLFLPAAGWIALHLPRLLEFADPRVVWHAPVDLTEMARIADFLIGDLALVPALVFTAIAAWYVGGRMRVAADVPAAALIAIVASAGGAAILVTLGILRPSFTLRYLIPFVPGVLLALAFTGRWLGRQWSAAPIGMIAIFAIAAGAWASEGGRQGIRFYSFEATSRALANTGARDVVFVWDNPVADVYRPAQLAQLAGFFFRRAGHDATIRPIILQPGDDPNLRLLDAASPRSAILWLYDLRLPPTLTRTHLPRIPEIDPAWRCRQFGVAQYGVLACDRPEINASPGTP